MARYESLDFSVSYDLLTIRSPALSNMEATRSKHLSASITGVSTRNAVAGILAETPRCVSVRVCLVGIDPATMKPR